MFSVRELINVSDPILGRDDAIEEKKVQEPVK